MRPDIENTLGGVGGDEYSTSDFDYPYAFGGHRLDLHFLQFPGAQPESPKPAGFHGVIEVDSGFKQGTKMDGFDTPLLDRRNRYPSLDKQNRQGSRIMVNA
ncbi:hypothetical protein KQI84_18125 [bacterium]|nr:hypothetical protein [bacterium]